jgi:hypothetical protein
MDGKKIAPKRPLNGILIFPVAFLLVLLSEQSLSLINKKNYTPKS